MMPFLFGREQFTFVKKYNTPKEAEQKLKKLKKDGYLGRINYVNNKFYLYKGYKRRKSNGFKS